MLAPTYLTSSNLDAAGYQKGQLYIRFKSGCTYSYAKVPYDRFDGLCSAESAGQFFHREIRGKFHCTKLDLDPFTPDN